MVYKFKVSETAKRDLRRIPCEDTRKIFRKLYSYLGLKNPLIRAKKLKGIGFEAYGYRVGDYRVIVRKDEKSGELVLLVILRAVHRKDAYKN